MQTVIRLLPDRIPGQGMEPSRLTPPEAFLTDDHTEMNSTFLEGRDGDLLVGVWECAPSREEIESYPVDEMMTVISGSVEIATNGQPSETFREGDTFIISKGTKCVWKNTETVRKFYMIMK